MKTGKTSASQVFFGNIENVVVDSSGAKKLANCALFVESMKLDWIVQRCI